MAPLECLRVHQIFFSPSLLFLPFLLFSFLVYPTVPFSVPISEGKYPQIPFFFPSLETSPTFLTSCAALIVGGSGHPSDASAITMEVD